MPKKKPRKPSELINRLQKRKKQSAEELRQRLKKAQKQVAAKIEAATEKQAIATSSRARNKLYAAVAAKYEVTSAEIDQWMRELTGETAIEWHNEALDDIKGREGKVVVAKFSRDRVKRYWEMVHPGNQRYLAAVFTDQMVRSDIRHLRRAFTNTFRQQVVEGWTARETHKALQAEWDRLAKNLRADRFVDAAGRKWANADYLNMLSRTTFSKVQRESYVDTLVENDYKLAMIVDDGEPCDVCRAWSGLIVDVSGRQNSQFPALAQAYDGGWGHPNCGCRLEFVSPTLDSEEIQRQQGQNAAKWGNVEDVQAYNDEINIRRYKDQGLSGKAAEREMKRDKIKRDLRFAEYPPEYADQIPDNVLDRMNRTETPRIERAKKEDKENSSRNSSRGGVIHLSKGAGDEQFVDVFLDLQGKRGNVKKD